jgi:uncharacterized protein YggE
MMRAIRFAGAAAVALAAAGAVRAGDPPQRVSVVVKGRATATADSLEVEFTVAGNADESADAEKRYREKRARVLEALKDDGSAPKTVEKPAKKADDDDDDDDAPKKRVKRAEKPKKVEKPAEPEAPSPPIAVALSERALSIGAKPKDKGEDGLFGRIIINRMNQNKKPDPPPMQVRSLVVATIHGVGAIEREPLSRRVAALIDKAIEAGADGADGTPPVVRFLVDDPEPLRQRAYKDAMAKARARAQALAELGERKLGKMVSVREVTGAPKEASAEVGSEATAVVEGILGGKAATTPARSLPEFATEVELRVEFELAP